MSAAMRQLSSACSSLGRLSRCVGSKHSMSESTSMTVALKWGGHANRWVALKSAKKGHFSGTTEANGG